MRVLKQECKFCIACMTKHVVQTVVQNESIDGVTYGAIYDYCERTNELLEDEDMIRRNMQAMKGACGGD